MDPAVTVGGVESITRTVDVAVPTLPQGSCDMNVTVVGAPGAQPEGRNAGASLDGMLAPPQRSLAAAAPSHLTTRGSLDGTPPGDVHSMTSGAGGVIMGGVLSMRVP